MSSSRKQRGRGRGGRTRKIFNNRHNSSASFIGSNVDILTLVLTRLPSKSLLVFKSVSKQWLCLITDPKFVHKHFIQNPRLSIPGLFWGDDLYYGGKPTYDYISLDGNTNRYASFETLTFAEDEYGIKIEQSCNGLLLCKSNSDSLSDYTFYIFNPFTNMYRILPQSQLSSISGRCVDSVSLAFDPFKSPYYKVITFWRIHNQGCYQHRIEIYDSETSSWRLSGSEPKAENNDNVPWGSGVFWNGSLYWCNHKGYIVHFDIDRDLVGVVPLPSPARDYDGTKSFSIAEYGGRFYLFERCVGRYMGRRFSIFEMDAANCGWNAKGQVDVRLNPYGWPPYAPSFGWPLRDNILFISERGEEKESTRVVLLTEMSMVIVSYDMKDMRFENINY